MSHRPKTALEPQPWPLPPEGPPSAQLPSSPDPSSWPSSSQLVSSSPQLASSSPSSDPSLWSSPRPSPSQLPSSPSSDPSLWSSPSPSPDPSSWPSPAARPSPSEVRILTPRTGWVIGVESGSLLVDYPGNLRGPLPARTTVPLDARGALSAAASRQGALLVFEDGDPAQPVLIGLLQPKVTTLIDLVMEATDAADPPSEPAVTRVAATGGTATATTTMGEPATGGTATATTTMGEPATGVSATATATMGETATGVEGGEAREPVVTASADGKRVSIEGEEEVTLRCGKASISLRRDGRVVIRGAYVETHASGTNRIKGGSVQIN